jgi:hypothetical protein
MAFVFHRGLGLPLWAIVFFTVALTAPPPATPFLMPPTMLFVIGAVGIGAIVFSARGAIPWLRTSRALVRTLDEPNRSEADDALDLGRMDDDGGWQMPRPPANG